MRRAEREIKDLQELTQILKETGVLRLGMVDEGKPYVVPLNFGYKDHILYVHSALSGRKIDVLKKNNQVCFEVDTDMMIVPGDSACNYTAKYKSVIGSGQAFFIEDEEEKRQALDILMEHYVKESLIGFEYMQKAVDKIAVIKIIIDEMTGKKSGY